MKNRQHKQHSIYLLPSEAEQIRNKAAPLRMSVSEFCRSAALGLPLPGHRLITPEQWRQLSAVGNNLNQIAKRLNAGQQISALAATETAQTVLVDIRDWLQGVAR